MNVSATPPPPPEVCHGPSQTESLCLWTSLCRPACCPFCPFLSQGSQRSRDVFWLQTRHRPCAADSSPLGPWWSPARISGEGKKLWLRSKGFTANEKKKAPYPEVLTLTLRTSLAWNSAVQLWWIIPIPPINWKETQGKLRAAFETATGHQTNGEKQMLWCLCAALLLTAMAMAMDDSVTVSMGDEMRGVFRVIFLVNAEVRSSNLNAFGSKQDKILWPYK